MDNNSQLELEITRLRTVLNTVENCFGIFMSVISKNKEKFNHRKNLILIQYINILF